MHLACREILGSNFSTERDTGEFLKQRTDRLPVLLKLARGREILVSTFSMERDIWEYLYLAERYWGVPLACRDILGSIFSRQRDTGEYL